MTVQTATAVLRLPSGATPVVLVLCGCLIAMISFGPRSSLGFFLAPLSQTNHWGRDVFAFALALQNLLWGIGQPVAGAIADRYGAPRVLALGAVLYGLGLYLMSLFDHAADADFVGRRPDRLRPVGLRFHHRGRRARQTGAAGMALNGIWFWHGGRLVRPVPVLAARGRADGRVRLANHAVDIRRFDGVHPAVVARAVDAARRRAIRSGGAQRSRCATRWPRPSRIAATCCWCSASLPAASSSASPRCICRPTLLDRGLSAEIGGWTLATIGLFNIIGSVCFGLSRQR